jgi:ATP-dependent exoDNAse (exonuclease V) alpha subunit
MPTSSVIYYARDEESVAKTLKTLTKDCLAPEKLELKIGAQVMLTVNQFERKLVNGSQGVIINFKEEEGKKYPVVKFSSGKIAVVKPFEHKLLAYRNNQEITLASRCQIPLILC